MQQVMHISQVLAETFKTNANTTNLTAWVNAMETQPMPGQLELPLLFCDEVNSEFVR